VRTKWKAIGYPLEEMPPGIFPVDPNDEPIEIARRQIKLLQAGVMGAPNGRPKSSPEIQRIYFDLVSRSVDTSQAAAPMTIQWRFSDADPWHLVIDNGSSHAEPGEAPNPTVTFESSWGDWIASGKPDANPLKMVLQRKIRPRGSIRELARLRKVFPS
jgi:hypothetical protein